MRSEIEKLRVRAEFVSAIRSLPWITPEQAALVLDVHSATIRRALVRGQLAGVRIGKLWRLRPAALDDWLMKESKT